MWHLLPRLLLLASLAVVYVNAKSCPVQYRGDGLLFGGVGSQCVSGCKSRSSEVSRTCGFQGYQADVWGLCNAQQIENNRSELQLSAQGCCACQAGLLAATAHAYSLPDMSSMYRHICMAMH
jgi:hypothetical protein